VSTLPNVCRHARAPNVGDVERPESDGTSHVVVLAFLMLMSLMKTDALAPTQTRTVASLQTLGRRY
jgi:hypothetical protein